MAISNNRGYSWFEATASLTAQYPAGSGAGHVTTTAGSSVLATANKSYIHSISVTSPIAGNSILVQNHGGTVTYFTIGAAVVGTFVLDLQIESGFRVVGGSAGTATCLITYWPLT